VQGAPPSEESQRITYVAIIMLATVALGTRFAFAFAIPTDEDRQNRVRAARSLIYQQGYVVNSTHVDDLLKADSLVPTKVRIAVFSSQHH